MAWGGDCKKAGLCPLILLCFQWIFSADYLLIATLANFAIATEDIFRPLVLGLFMNAHYFLIMVV